MISNTIKFSQQNKFILNLFLIQYLIFIRTGALYCPVCPDSSFSTVDLTSHLMQVSFLNRFMRWKLINDQQMKSQEQPTIAVLKGV